MYTQAYTSLSLSHSLSLSLTHTHTHTRTHTYRHTQIDRHLLAQEIQKGHHTLHEKLH